MLDDPAALCFPQALWDPEGVAGGGRSSLALVGGTVAVLRSLRPGRVPLASMSALRPEADTGSGRDYVR
jgi:hypothetical protein